jgi:hypothetical protein
MLSFCRKSDKNNPGIMPQSESISGNKMVKDVYEDLGKIQRQMSGLEQQAREAVERLNHVSSEYDQLQTSHQNLLKKASEALQVCDVALTRSYQCAKEVLESLQNTLNEQGVEEFQPAVGDLIVEGTCRVIAELPSYEMPPGSVAKVQAPGLRLSHGKAVLVPALVYKSVSKSSA